MTGTLIAVAPRGRERLATAAADCARVGAAVLIPPPGASAQELTAVHAETGLLVAGEHVVLDAVHVLDDGQGLHAVSDLLRGLPDGTVAVLGGAVEVQLAALAGGAHLRVGTADRPEGGRDDAQLVAFAAGLARLARREPLSPDSAMRLLGGGEPA